MTARARSRFALMTREQLIKLCRERYARHGIGALTYKSLRLEAGLYSSLYRRGLRQTKLARILGLDDAFREYRDEHWERRKDGKIQRRWTWERIRDDARKVAEENGFLPPAVWFHANGRGSLVTALYTLGRTWADLRSECDSFQGGGFVESRNRMRWRSHPEASLSNFLHARGSPHRPGRKYPPEYSKETGLAYGYYDLAFLDKRKKWIDVEIWGEKPHGHKEKLYAEKRALKERFNASNPNFLGIEFRDCYSESRLSAVLRPYIGVIAPYVFERPSDRIIPSTHWSNADELLETCRQCARQLPNGKFPTEEWLRKRGKWKNRVGPAYNTLAVYIRLWIGGVRKLRKLLGQPENSTNEWSRDSALAAYRKWYDSYGRSPSSMRKMHERGHLKMAKTELRWAAVIAHAASAYVGNTAEVHRILGLPAPRKSPTWHRR